MSETQNPLDAALAAVSLSKMTTDALRAEVARLQDAYTASDILKRDAIWQELQSRENSWFSA